MNGKKLGKFSYVKKITYLEEVFGTVDSEILSESIQNRSNSA